MNRSSSAARALAGALAVAALAAPAAARAKSFYITVNRSYGSAESPVVEVAFERRGPVLLRVLRPESLDSYLDAQLNLRRAYTAPPVRQNPGRELARGVNALRFPGAWLYRALDPEARRELAKALPPREGQGGVTSRLAEGSERLVGVPVGMQVVRSEWLNLDLGGAERDFNVAGFDGYGSWRWRSEYEQRRIALEPLAPGVYVLQLVQGRVEGQVVLVVSDLRVQVKQTDGEVLVRVAGSDLAPRKGVAVALRSAAGRGPTGRTDANGEVRLAAKEPRLLVTATSGSDVALVDTDFYSTLAATPDVFLYADRPMYRPGDEVRFRGLLRKPDGMFARLLAPREREVRVQLVSDGGRTVETRAPIDEFGSFSGSLTVPGDAPAGVVRLVATVDGAPHQSEARVQEYVKPTFFVEVLGETDAVHPGKTLKAHVRARRFAGGAPKDARYEVFLYRSLVDAPSWLDDAGLGARGSAVTYGSASTTEGKLSVPERLYSSLANRGASALRDDDPWSSAPALDANGEAELSIPVPALAEGDDRYPWRYTLSVRARDDQGTFAAGARPYYLASSEVIGVVRPSAPVVRAGGKAELAVRATTLSGRPFGETGGELELFLRRADGGERLLTRERFRTGADGVWRVALPARDPGTLVARVKLEDRQKRPWSGEASLVVIGLRGEEAVRVPALTLAALGGPVAPGDAAELVALLPAGWGAGRGEKGRVWVTLSGTGLFETRVVEVSGFSLVHRFKVEPRFGSAVYASIAYPTATGRWEERTAYFRIVPPERVLGVRVSPARAETSPLGQQTLDLTVTDHRGRGVVAQVSVGVVDKAVYALQAELRPSALDFFYPLVRDNVTTFTSAEFQGYGYGEALARALRRPGFGFAAVKPPTKVRETDTAYWNPAVVTDANGHARVTFVLPGNQTIWTVTAVAADTSGRFGEGTAEFTSRGTTSIATALPAFLREGDEAVGSVRIARAPTAPATRIALDVNLAGALAGAGRAEAVELAPGGERLVPFQLRAARIGTADVKLTVSGSEGPLLDARQLSVKTSGIEEVMTAGGYGGGRIALDVPAGAAVTSLELALRPSTLAAALANVEELLVYPHGCLEQLVATTIPNVALYRTLEQAGALEKLDAPSVALMKEARARAVQGVSRILALAQKGGGFTWFPGESQPSVPLTLVALDGLAYAIDAGLVNRHDPTVHESVQWLARQDRLEPELEATRTWVLSRLQQRRAAASARALVERAAPVTRTRSRWLFSRPRRPASPPSRR